MASCCDNVVTPKMIKSGQVSVGDRIQLEDIPVSSQQPAETEASPAKESPYIEAASPRLEAEKSQVSPGAGATLPFSRMTSYMNNVSLNGEGEAPSITTPRAPMTPDGFDESIDYDSVQSFNGFLRTQIGRYMRVEQLIGSNTIEDRFGFLVGVGNNFIILQEITTGNIMLLDIFSIRLTYVYYSQPVFPQ